MGTLGGGITYGKESGSGACAANGINRRESWPLMASCVASAAIGAAPLPSLRGHLALILQLLIRVSALRELALARALAPLLEINPLLLVLPQRPRQRVRQLVDRRVHVLSLCLCVEHVLVNTVHRRLRDVRLLTLVLRIVESPRLDLQVQHQVVGQQRAERLERLRQLLVGERADAV